MAISCGKIKVRFLAACMSAAITLGLAAFASAADEPGLLLTGTDEAVWLVIPHDGKFDVMARPAGGDWDWVSRDVSGSVAVATASGRNLNVMLGQPLTHGLFSLPQRQETTGQAMTTLVTPTHPKWPSQALPVAMTVAARLGKETAPSLVAIVPGSATAGSTTAPASLPVTLPAERAAMHEPASRPVRLEQLAAFQNTHDNKWVFLGERPVRARYDGRVFCAAVKGQLFVLIAGPAGENRLFVMNSQDKSPPKPLTQKPLADAQALAMLEVNDRLLILMARPAAKGTRQVFIATREDDGRFSTVDLRTDKPWRADELPLATRMGDKVELVWPSGQTLLSSSYDPSSGQMVAPAEIKAFVQAQGSLGQEAYKYFMIGVFGVSILIVFFLRPRGIPKPFALAPQRRLGSPARRLIAGFVDLVPFVGAAYLVFPFSQVTAEDAWSMLQDNLTGNDTFYYFVIAATSSYMVYCTIMEYAMNATVGKLLLGLRVVGDDGARPRLQAVILRNVMKVIEMLWAWPWMLPMLFLFPIFSRFRQRLGDMLAKTAVVRSQLVELPADSANPDEPTESK